MSVPLEAPTGELPVDLPAGPMDGGSRLLRPVLLLTAVVGCLLLAYASPLHEMLRTDELRALVERFGARSSAAFLVVCALGVGIGAPRLGFSAVAGLLFPWWEGILLAQAGTLVGCTIAFLWSRRLGGDFARARAKGRLLRLIARVERHPVSTNVLIRVFPIGNALALNVLLGLTPMRLRDFVAGTFLGTLPHTVIYVLLGNSASAGSAGRLLTAFGLLVALAAVSWMLLRRSPDAAD